jgi:hypothetical protein
MKDNTRDSKGRFLKGRIRPEQELRKSKIALKGRPSGMLGKKHSEEWKIERSIAQTGKPHLTPEGKERLRIFNLGNKYCLGKKRSKETKLKLRLLKLGSKNPSFGKIGNLSPVWKGGKSFEPYGLDFNKELREQIRQRDNHRCQECFRHQNELGYKLSIHHIDFNKKNNNPSNLISLCTNCHLQTNFNRDNWENYFKETMELRGLK